MRLEDGRTDLRAEALRLHARVHAAHHHVYTYSHHRRYVWTCVHICVFYIYRQFTENLDIQKYIKYIESKGFLGGSAVQNSLTMQKPQETGV